jgi:GTP-binding protein
VNTATAARRLFAQPCDFITAAASPEQFPPSTLPEIAFVGRSNAGKSSLVNALTGRKSLAHASNTPGRTQQIVFFNLAGKLMLADLPGYGYARASGPAINAWNKLVRHYLRTRKSLRCVCLLIDGRHGALANDLSMMDELDRAAVSYQVVLTKVDGLKFPLHEKRLRDVTALITKHPAARPDAFMVSANTGLGIGELREWLAGFV